ncbi:MAG TPA: GAF domain-containing protein, partial [Acidimicrobiia bacterium]|nr:GAF domain-containing protein [Acidimicrobiia bacterium]
MSVEERNLAHEDAPQPRLEVGDGDTRPAAEADDPSRLADPWASERELAVRSHARALQQRALADAAMVMSRAESVEHLLRIVTESAREIIGAHQAVTSRLRHGWDDASTYVSLSDKYAAYRDYDQMPKGLGILNVVTRENRPLRLTGLEMEKHPEWRGLQDAPGHPPLPNYLAAPLVGRGGENLGLIQMADKVGDEDFTAEDEAMLVQLAQMASGVIQSLELVERERARNAALAREAWRRGVLAEAGRALAACLSADEIVSVLRRATIRDLADLLVLHEVDEEGRIRLTTTVHHDPELEAMTADVIAALTITRNDDVGVGYVLRTGQPEVLPPVSDLLLKQVARSSEELERLRALDLRSTMVVPLTARGKVVGTLSFVRQCEPEFDSDDLAFAEELAQRAALALDNVAMLGASTELATRYEQTLDHLSLALDAARMGTWEWDVAAGTVRWSDTLEHIYGFEPGSFPGTFEAYIERVHPDDREAALASVQQAAETRSRFDYAYRIVRLDGSVRVIEGAGQPLLDEHGELSGMAGVCLDVTERRAAEERLRREHQLAGALHEVGKAIVSRLDLEEVVQTVTDTATALTGADIGAFFYNVVDDEGEEFLLFSLSGAPRSEFERFPMPRNTKIFDPTFRGTGPVRIDDVLADARYGQNPPYHGMPEGHFPVRSYMAVPVHARGGAVIGGLFFGHHEPGTFSADDERLVIGVAAQAAIAIENARLYEEAQREIEARHQAYQERARVARVLQASLLPPNLPTVAGLTLAARYQPGSEDVGGDFYDVFPLRGRTWGVALGDVCGKGPEAAALTALTRHALRTAGMIHRHPSQALRTLNEAVLRSEEHARFCSALFARLRMHDEG